MQILSVDLQFGNAGRGCKSRPYGSGLWACTEML